MAKLHRRVSKLPHPHLILGLLLAGLVAWAGPARADDPEIADADDPRVARLSQLFEQLAHEDAGQRDAAFEALTTLDEDMLPAIRRRQERMHLGRPERRWAVDILNRFRRRGRAEEGQPPDLAEGARLELAERHRTRERGWVLKMAEVAVLWRALDQIGTVEAHRVAFPLIASDRGLWMPEARNWVRQRGPALMAAAIHARRAEQPQTRRWGAWAMEELGADEPGRAIQELPEDQLPPVLRAYAELRMQSAMRVIVSYVDHPRRDIRHAARWAMEQYAGNGIWILRTEYRNQTGEHPPREWAWRRVSDELYTHVDAERLAPVRAALDEGVAARERGDLDAMRERFDAVLAQVAEVDEPNVLAEGYAELAAAAAEREDWADAAVAYRRALRLAPDGAPAADWTRALAFVDAERLRARGVFDEDAYEALATDPEHPAAAILAEAPQVGAPTDDRERTTWALVAVIALVLLGLGLLWRGRPETPGPVTLDETLPPELEDDTTLQDSTLPG